MKKWVLAIGNDNNYFVEVQKTALKYNIFICHTETMEEALNLINDDYFLIIIWADGLNYMKWFELMRGLRPLPILVISSNNNYPEMIQALEKGADSYLSGNLNLDYILASGLALIRSHTKDTSIFNSTYDVTKTLVYHHIFLCVDSQKVFFRTKEIFLTRKEFDILHLLMTKPRKVLSYANLCEYIWKTSYNKTQYEKIHKHIYRLREKLKSKEAPSYIVNIYNIGYTLDAGYDSAY